jgi:uncharacterized protein YecT (DUF1311 family)
MPVTRKNVLTCSLVWALLVAFSIAAASAEERAGSAMPKGLSPTYLACQKRAQGAIEQAACLSAEEAVQDKRLNRIYKQLLGKLDADGKSKLVEAQRAWLQSRAKDDALDATLYGDTQAENLGSTEAALFRLCARADQLEHYLRLLD